MAWRGQGMRRRGAWAIRGRRALTAMACAVALFAACQGSAVSPPSLRIEHEISPQPPRVGPATFSLKLSDAAARPVTGAHVTLEGNMTHAGMTPVGAVATEVGPGHYRATLEFTMGGDWVVIVHAALPDGQKLEHLVDVKGVRTD